jgi:hypothetical protein
MIESGLIERTEGRLSYELRVESLRLFCETGEGKPFEPAPV